jgi:hypothetical protein
VVTVRHKKHANREEQNRRRHERVAARLAISAKDGAQPVLIEAANVCEEGAYCTSDSPLSVMTRLAVSLELPDGGEPGLPVQIDAIVVRCEPHPVSSRTWNLAFYFPDLGDEARRRIAAFIRRRREEEASHLASSGPAGPTGH